MDASHSNLNALLTKALEPFGSEAPIAVALSGGADSVALALIAVEHCTATKRPLYFFHVHHGLMAQADAWVAHLQQFSQALKIQLQVRQVQVDLAAGLGIEGAARDARYLALAQLCAEHGVAALLLAHHRQDQAETVLLRLLRGTGVSGLAAMQADVEQAHDLYQSNQQHVTALQAENAQLRLQLFEAGAPPPPREQERLCSVLWRQTDRPAGYGA
jgi:tRNA(Ile)-lysidine synthase